jgi:protein-disulfide isomerase
MKRIVITLAVTLLVACALGYGVPAMMQMSQARQDQQDAAQAAEQSRNVTAHRNALFADARDPVAGNPDGGVTIVEFFDYRCPYCKAIAGSLDQLLTEDKGVRLVLKEFPILGDDSVLASRVALAVLADKYWTFHQALLQHHGTFDLPTLKAIAKSVRINADQMEAGMNAAATSLVLQGNRDLAKTIGVAATPSFVIGDQVIVGVIPPETLAELIKKARKG